MAKMHQLVERKKAINAQEAEDGIIPFRAKRRQDSVCPLCKDAGYRRVDVPFEDPLFGKAIQCSCRSAQIKQQHQQDLIAQSGILEFEKFRDASFDNFHLFVPGVRRAFKQAMEFAECPVGWLILTGTYGCGKTHLAAAIARKRIEEGDIVIVQTVPDLLAQLRAAFSPAVEQSFEEAFDEMRNAELLVLDDFGAQKTTAWADEQLFRMLNHRYNKKLPTVFTSNNIHLDGVDPRIYSRMMDRHLACLVKMEGARDYRIHDNVEDNED